MTKVNSIDEYIENKPVRIRKILQKIRKEIKKIVPGSEEVISYQIPAFKFHGMLIWFAAFENHIGIYPGKQAIKKFKKELTVYKKGKGSVQFQIDKPIPFKIINKIVKFKIKENLDKVNKN